MVRLAAWLIRTKKSKLSRRNARKSRGLDPRIESEPIGASGLGEVSERNRDVHLVDGRSTGPFDRTKVDIAQTNTSSSPGALSSYAIDNKTSAWFSTETGDDRTAGTGWKRDARKPRCTVTNQRQSPIQVTA